MGFSDLGCYGSEILTPNIDSLAKGGLRFTQFYNAGRCCPTRASLLTGVYPHQTGVGHMMGDWQRPGYRGNINSECVTIAELLTGAGYQTMIAGKWHLSLHTDRGGPKYNWPLQRGFEKFYGIIHGGASYFNPVTLTRDNDFIAPTGDYYLTDEISDHAVGYIESAARIERPFFLYVAYTAPHWPLHAPDDVVSRYRGNYGRGWDEVRIERHRRMIQQGIVKAQWPLTPRDSRVLPWEQVSYQQWHQRRMEVYAAQVDIMDRGVGRIMEKLRQVGRENNTLVLFLSDNGGCAEEVGTTWKGLHIPEKTRSGHSLQVGNRTNVMPGPENTYQSYGVPWANVSNTPFRLYKHWVHEGGIATPLVAYWPGVIRPGGLTHEVGHVVDVMPTCLAAAHIGYPAKFRALDITPTEGESLVPIFLGNSRQRGPIFWEHEGNRAVRDGKWKLVSRHPGQWELYDMEADRTEMKDLAAQFPAIVKYMSELYNKWAARANVLPWPE